MIPLSVPNFEGNEEKYTLDAVSQGWVSTGGAYVDKLEKQIAEYAGVSAAVACQSGTAALHLSLIECGVGLHDMVIVPTLTFIAAVNPVKYVHAEPIFMDCDDSLCMDPEKLKSFCEEECIFESGKLLYTKTRQVVKAIMVVHVFGNLADMESIMEIATAYNLKVIEDATEALGSYYEDGKYKGRMAGSIGDFGAYSFNGNKIITTGGGGAIISNDLKALEHLKYLSTQAKDDTHFYIHNEVGYNYRMTNVQAALGVAQMEELEEFIVRKNANYETYKANLMSQKNGALLGFRKCTRSNKWFYSFMLNKDVCKGDIKGYIVKLQEEGVQTRPIWGLIHEQKPYQKTVAYQIEKAKYYSERIINIPCSTNIDKCDILKVCERLTLINEN
ncbi:MAG: LegC family aminotransferase [Lachnospiraceae bacterium]